MGENNKKTSAASGHSSEAVCRFMGLDLLLAPGVLVPRGETELLARSAIDILRTLEAPLVVDMCCGSGNLAAAIAHHCPKARVWAADLTDDTTALARRNVERLGLSERVTVRQGDLFASLAQDRLDGTVDVVVCNPPYISTSALESEKASLLDSEPREAFDGGPYGISILQRLVKEALGVLKPGGWLLFEFGEGQHKLVASLLARSKSYGAISFAETDGTPRVAIAKRLAGVQT
ncbi:HemK-like putative methylase [Variibacter gotjawalensis]|nr:HemK-like putative methylase [Variibacter gotjawalensis]RZS50636.1 HemK-like putative methylase [Variibacter gotjawalensis]